MMKPVTLEQILASPLFVAASVLMSVVGVFTVHIFDILFAVGMWMAYSAAKAGHLSEKTSSLKLIRSTAKAYCVFRWLMVVFLVLSALAVFVLPIYSDAVRTKINTVDFDSLEQVLAEAVEDDDDFRETLDVFRDLGYQIDLNNIGEKILSFVNGDLWTTAFKIISVAGGVLLLLSAGIQAVITVLYFGNLTKFTDSLFAHTVSGTALVKAGTVKVWFLILAVVSGLSVLPAAASTVTFLVNGSKTALFILLYLLVRDAEKLISPNTETQEALPTEN